MLQLVKSNKTKVQINFSSDKAFQFSNFLLPGQIFPDNFPIFYEMDNVNPDHTTEIGYSIAIYMIGNNGTVISCNSYLSKALHIS